MPQESGDCSRQGADPRFARHELTLWYSIFQNPALRWQWSPLCCHYLSHSWEWMLNYCCLNIIFYQIILTPGAALNYSPGCFVIFCAIFCFLSLLPLYFWLSRSAPQIILFLPHSLPFRIPGNNAPASFLLRKMVLPCLIPEKLTNNYQFPILTLLKFNAMASSGLRSSGYRCRRSFIITLPLFRRILKIPSLPDLCLCPGYFNNCACNQKIPK